MCKTFKIYSYKEVFDIKVMIKNIFPLFDSNGSGDITLDEFL